MKNNELRIITDNLATALESYIFAYNIDGLHDTSECFCTGPNTGDSIKDFVECPGCRAFKLSTYALNEYKNFKKREKEELSDIKNKEIATRSSTIVRYLRNERGHIDGCFVAFEQRGQIYIGMSVRNKQDEPNKLCAKVVAVTRAKQWHINYEEFFTFLRNVSYCKNNFLQLIDFLKFVDQKKSNKEMPNWCYRLFRKIDKYDLRNRNLSSKELRYIVSKILK